MRPITGNTKDMPQRTRTYRLTHAEREHVAVFMKATVPLIKKFRSEAEQRGYEQSAQAFRDLSMIIDHVLKPFQWGQ